MKYLTIFSFIVSLICMVIVHDLHCEVRDLKQNLAQIGGRFSPGIINTGRQFVTEKYHKTFSEQVADIVAEEVNG